MICQIDRLVERSRRREGREGKNWLIPEIEMDWIGLD